MDMIRKNNALIRKNLLILKLRSRVDELEKQIEQINKPLYYVNKDVVIPLDYISQQKCISELLSRQQQLDVALQYMADNGCTMDKKCISGDWDSMCFACIAEEVLKGGER
jgi:hypothetical protein